MDRLDALDTINDRVSQQLAITDLLISAEPKAELGGEAMAALGSLLRDFAKDIARAAEILAS